MSGNFTHDEYTDLMDLDNDHIYESIVDDIRIRYDVDDILRKNYHMLNANT